MSELDIELQKQTQDVSVTEMMQEAENMQITLKQEEKQQVKEDEQIGE